MNARLIAAAALFAATASAAPAFAQAVDGATLYTQRCNVCHNGSPTARGPALKANPIGKNVAGVAGYEYSAGLKGKGGKWTEALLDTYLTDPKAFSGPDGKMAVKIADPAQRKALIAHMKTLK